MVVVVVEGEGGKSQLKTFHNFVFGAYYNGITKNTSSFDTRAGSQHVIVKYY